ncbi:hypothetical protein SteCoe_6804 [Stentor coeruleus]|uniref:AMP-dependent synthetase/ligase domain-containing protein n=1 Tax=Stentor coeruleus TaxID=5963 RepID=A0A1R2CNZ6_9CILI|nr:hypothetical protein SteCoe_6804 [Stentor coeruleus]
MGSSESLSQIEYPSYFVKLETNRPAESPVLLNVSHQSELLRSPSPEIWTMVDWYDKVLAKFSQRPMLGTRKGNIYSWKTYNEVYELALNFGSGIENLGLCPEENHDGFSVKFISIYSINREEWNIADIGCTLYRISNVPLYDSLVKDHIDYIFSQTNLKTVVLSSNKLSRILELRREGKGQSLQTIISIEDPNDEQRAECQNLNIKLYSFNEIIAIGKENRKDIIRAQPKDLYSLSYSSGTTGSPKGVIITHENMVANLAGVIEILQITCDDVHLSYLPAAHIYEKVLSNVFYYCGGAIGFYSGDPQKLREDMYFLKPTVLACVPRILNRFSEVFRASVSSEPEKKRKVIQKMIDEKLERLRKYGDPTHKLYDFLYFNKFKKLFGGKIRLGTTAAAPMNGQTLDLIKIFFCCNFIEAYGQTEVAGATTFTTQKDMRSGQIGGPIGCMKVKLVDIPDMLYSSSNNPPSGEICVKGLSVQPKYFKNPEATAEVFDEEGWMHTGDVAILRDDGCLSIIDRKKSFLKLSQGEFVSPERVENIYMQCGCISFVFAYGDTFQNHLVSVVVPDRVFVEKEAQKHGIEKSWEDLCNDPLIKKLVLEKMSETGKKLGLSSVEQIRKIYLHPVMITPDSGLLTPTFKMKRKELREYFVNEIKQMYNEHHHHTHTL